MKIENGLSEQSEGPSFLWQPSPRHKKAPLFHSEAFQKCIGNSYIKIVCSLSGPIDIMLSLLPI